MTPVSAHCACMHRNNVYVCMCHFFISNIFDVLISTNNCEMSTKLELYDAKNGIKLIELTWNDPHLQFKYYINELNICMAA